MNTATNHNCLEHLDKYCRCKICGAKKHFIASDCQGFGIGRVNVACLRCGLTSAFEDSTGGPIYSDFEEDNDPKNPGAERTSKEEVIYHLKRNGHECTQYADELSGVCLVCGKQTKGV